MTTFISKTSILKRKKKSTGIAASRKRQRRTVDSVDHLPWKKLSRPNAVGFEGDEGILELEEVDDIEVEYEETENGRLVRFKVRDPMDRENQEEIEPEGNELEQGSVTEAEETFDASLLPDWSEFALHPRLLSALHGQGFSTPTPIQRAALPIAMKGKDVVGVAETGSGKTLAYGLPILHDILEHKAGDRKRTLRALIIAPTRELALQVSAHLNACVSKEAENSNGPPRVSIGTVVGGMAVQKQLRILDRGVDVLVATPGRLWDLIEENDNLSEQLKRLRFLVLDEADRMIEAGHFAELDSIIRLTTRQMKTPETDEAFISEGSPATRVNSENEEEAPMQTFIFSATLSRDLQQNLKRRKRKSNGFNKKGKQEKPVSTLDELLFKLDFRDPEPEVIDLSPKGGAVSTLQESQVECLSADKDVYLYYFLLRYPGRSLVFLSSIDGIRRLLPLCELLQLHAYPLHSQLQQRQRLKNLDRFKSTPNSILLATDVAARGLDIPSVDHVIHYQIPRSADVYIHRNGRTARALRSGFSLIMCAPDERRILRALLSGLDRVDENEIPDMPVDLDLLDKLKSRVQLAKRVDTTAHRDKKEKHEKNWLKKTAEAMEIELDSDLDERMSDEDSGPRKRKGAKDKYQLETLKAELRHQLSLPLVAKGVMKKYITSGARNVVSELMGSHGEDMLGYKKGGAKDDLVNAKGLARKKAPGPKNAEEWSVLSS